MQIFYQYARLRISKRKKSAIIELAGGFSSFAVAEGKAFTVVSRNIGGAPVEACVAIAAETGKEIWAAPTGVAKFEHGGDAGAPTAVPCAVATGNARNGAGVVIAATRLEQHPRDVGADFVRVA